MSKKLLRLIKNIPGWLSEREALFLEKQSLQTQKLSGVIVEIGSYCGRSTICLAQGNGKVYAIDPHKGFVESSRRYKPTLKSFKKNINEASMSRKIIPIVKTSKVAAKDWNKKIRFLFIDGLHDEKNASLDFALWSKHLIRNGVIAMHDSFCRWGGSEKVAIRKIVNSKDFYKIGVAGSIIYGVKGQGNLKHKLIKFIWQIFILSAVYMNRAKRILIDFPDILKTRKFKKRISFMKYKIVFYFVFYKIFKLNFLDEQNALLPNYIVL
jgi:MMP 1-O-methyltransferase